MVASRGFVVIRFDQRTMKTLLASAVMACAANGARATTTVSSQAYGSNGAGDQIFDFYRSSQPSMDSNSGQVLSVSDGPINGGRLVNTDYGYLKVKASVGSDFLHGVGYQYVSNSSFVEGSWSTTFNPGPASQITFHIATFGSISAYTSPASDQNDPFSSASLIFNVAVGNTYYNENGTATVDGVYGQTGDYSGFDQYSTSNSAVLFGEHAFVATVTPYQENQIYFDVQCGVGNSYSNLSLSTESFASCDLSHSIYWDGITSAKDAHGNNVAIPAINSPSGFDFRYSSPLDPHPLVPAPTPAPEPAGGVMLLGGLGLLGIARRRHR